MSEITLANGRGIVLVDEDDYDWLMEFSWHLSAKGYATRGFRWRSGNRTVQMHREIMGLEIGDPRQTDHINRVRLDNRKENLRIVSGMREQAQNQTPQRGRSSQYRGVAWDSETQFWRARVTVSGVRIDLGRFEDEEEAAEIAHKCRLERMPHYEGIST
jgi:hypothetical protein